ncbi:uncharacterized protein LAESUDRAFT_761090 [Laetiporus sulphureus 93-53]|uniref:Protein-S-isoprenylcysteine O-methyltransferase n=1 Tax=Laetiporus sulphureus 93-53 TaxID=1314785 RepID=A0A165DC43_9APHY|nr:uncharacterized protein LAESUDRAFT_761090 [Laetiporus sulphureus 93-53]KZT04530.1 hypothetical protein LAESUDRAFT_761090 [Laetiporus sulphureus 93-53]
MSLVKLPFLFAGTLATYTCLTPPHPAVPHSERPKDVVLAERIFSAIARVYTGGLKLLICSGSVIEMVVIIANKFSSHPIAQQILHNAVPGSISLVNRIGLSPMFLAGCGCGVVGGFIRYQCYRTLGRLFTYEISIRDNHQLITTGPYAWVRHPSYSGGFICCVGMGLCYASQGSYLKECGILDTTAGKVASVLYAAMIFYGTASLVVRAPQEDAMLRKEFGAEWDEWAKKVPYRMIPYVY